jgi:hypothetical protein
MTSLSSNGIHTLGKALEDGPSFTCPKSILEFSAGPSGRANLSVRTEAVRKILGSVRTLKLHHFF